MHSKQMSDLPPKALCSRKWHAPWKLECVLTEAMSEDPVRTVNSNSALAQIINEAQAVLYTTHFGPIQNAQM